MITKLTNTELNVLAVALDHMEDHLCDLLTNFDALGQEIPINDTNNNLVINLRLDAVKTLQTKLL